MREFLSFIFLMVLSVASLTLTSIGALFNAAGQMIHVYFTRCGVCHDMKYAKNLEQQTKPGPTISAKELN